MTEKPTPETLSHAEWLRNRAASPYFALARSGLLDSANAIERLERERDEARAQRDAAAVANCPALCIQFCAAYQEHRSVARLEAERDQLRVMWERDSTALGVMIAERNNARTVAEDNRARYVTAEKERDELAEALRGFLVIVNDSRGVAGFHMNGVIAEWSEFEEVENAEDILARLDAGKP